MNIEINGARILFTIPTNIPFLGDLRITQTLLSTWVVMAIITLLAFWLGRDLKLENISKRQAVAELLVEKLDGFVHSNMGANFDQYIPLVGTIFALSVVGNLISLLGLWSPTADLNTELAWAVVVFILITYHKIKASGFVGYLKGYLSPIFFMAPLNIISEVATPISMACRHFGNILSGTVISALLYAALAAGSYALLGLLGQNLVVALLIAGIGVYLAFQGRRLRKTGALTKKGKPAGGVRLAGGVILGILGGFGLLTQLPGAAGELFAEFPLLDVGIPAVTSLYFDWFGGCIQAFIFCTLTTIFIKQAAGEE